MRYYIKSPEVLQIARAAFPDYNGNKFAVCDFTGPMRLDSNWEGGSRDYYVVLDLATMRHAVIPENGTPFSNGGKIERISELPLNWAVVEHTYFCGKDLGIRIYVRAENLAKWLPASSAATELTRDQMIVLVATRSLKAFARFDEANQETGITRLAFDQAKAELIAKGLLKSNGAITDEGRNIAGDRQLYSFKQQPVAV